MLISFLNDVDVQQILEFKNSFGYYHPVILTGFFFWDTLYRLTQKRFMIECAAFLYSFSLQFLIRDYFTKNYNFSINFIILGLEPIDEQLLATLTGQTSFVDPAVEEQFKINY